VREIRQYYLCENSPETFSNSLCLYKKCSWNPWTTQPRPTTPYRREIIDLLIENFIPGSRDERTVMSLVCHVTSLSHVFKISSVTVTSLSRFFRDKSVTVTTLSQFFKLSGVTVTCHTCDMTVTSLSRLVCHCPCISAWFDGISGRRSALLDTDLLDYKCRIIIRQYL